MNNRILDDTEAGGVAVAIAHPANNLLTAFADFAVSETESMSGTYPLASVGI
ncbi:hypothetical protein [Microcoleus asticus]|uniref:hypothetical protein n=1 Tax=Microcoleus asticus TaxID=2815231 RepID=UPI001557954F|nr:hypothetical protein [Microcoleus asticus]